MEYLAVCDKFELGATGAIECNGTLSLVPVSELLTRFSLEDLDPQIIATSFGAGFVLVATLMSAGIAVKALLRVIKNA